MESHVAGHVSRKRLGTRLFGCLRTRIVKLIAPAARHAAADRARTVVWRLWVVARAELWRFAELSKLRRLAEHSELWRIARQQRR